MHPRGVTSLIGFVLGCGLLLFINLVPTLNPVASVILFGIIGAVLSRFVCPDSGDNAIAPGQVRVRGFFLGWAFSVGILITNEGTLQNFGIYCCVLSLFHLLEFFVTALTSPPTLTLDSFILNHSKQYAAAVVSTWLEYFVGAYFFPSKMDSTYLLPVGMILCIFGEIVRKGAMLMLWSDFTHLIRREKVDGHRLQTNGLYSYCRHPSYAGLLWWFVGLQVILRNPVTLVFWGTALARCLGKRITYEESRLCEYFEEYSEYQKRVPRTGVPFAKGFQDDKNK